MTDGELKRNFSSRSMMFSWVAFLSDESEKAQAKYIADANRGITDIENEMIIREIQVLCN